MAGVVNQRHNHVQPGFCRLCPSFLRPLHPRVPGTDHLEWNVFTKTRCARNQGRRKTASNQVVECVQKWPKNVCVIVAALVLQYLQQAGCRPTVAFSKRTVEAVMRGCKTSQCQSATITFRALVANFWNIGELLH